MAVVDIPSSLADLLAELPREDRERLLAELQPEIGAALQFDWPFWARPKQLPPGGTWNIWLQLAGRGAGKTRSGAEFIRARVEDKVNPWRRVALVGATAADVRDVMVEGESGILAISPPWNRPDYEPSKRRLTWPNGAIATTYSADEPDRLRGPQHDGAWADELAAWRYMDSWDQLLFGLRLGENPRVVVTTTPKPIPIIKSLIADPTCAVTRATTYENIKNLAPTFANRIVKRYEGTRLGRQELYAEILGDVPGALWNREMLDRLRVKRPPILTRIVVAVDPAVTSEEESNETGIVVVGLGKDDHLYVLDDLSGRMSPNEWATKVIAAYYRYQADRVVAEINNGGDLVEYTLRTIDKNVSYKGVRAAKGKYTRAEPVAALYEQNRAHHVGSFMTMEDQMCNWLPGTDSPDRMDAAVWGATELVIDPDEEALAKRAEVW